MDERGPLQAFALLAVTVSLKARTGKLLVSDKLALMVAFLGGCEDQPDASRAVREFLVSVDAYPQLAGGHMTFVAGRARNGDIMGLGGNQGNMVSINPYDPWARNAQYHWPEGSAPPHVTGLKTLPLITSAGSKLTNEA